MPSQKEALDAAMKAHGAWKTHLAMAIGSGQASFDPATVRRDDACAFGQWLHGEPSLRADAAFAEVRDLHARFHKAAAGVLTLALAGNKDQARQAMGKEGEFDRSSSDLMRSLIRWQGRL